MTEDEYLTKTLAERIIWLRSKDGPRGVLSHDSLAAILGTSRQVVISWEKKGAEPKKFFSQLADFSGFRPEVFSRRGAEELAQASFARRLLRAEEEGDRQRSTIERILAALAGAGIVVQEAEAAPRSAAIAAPARHPRKKR